MNPTKAVSRKKKEKIPDYLNLRSNGRKALLPQRL